MSAPAKTSREEEFARLALSRRLTTHEQARECVKIARDLARRGKQVAIEDVFVKKGYLRKPEAQAIARALGDSGKLELAPNSGATPQYASRGRRCPSCDKQVSSRDDDCPRCGADLETGGPGPGATTCPSCSRVVKIGTAICPKCALPIERRKRRRSGASWVDRLVVALVAAGCFYFIVYRHVMAKGPSGPADETGKTATERASDALSQRDLEATARALGEAIEEPDHAPELESAYVVALLRTGNVDKARQALATARQKRPDDLELRYAGVEVSVAAGQLDTAASELNGFADAARDDRWLRASARVASLALKRPEALAALEKIKQPAPGDGRRIAEICVELAQKASDEGKPADALAALEKAILRAPDWATPRRRLGLLCLEQGQNDQAKLQLDRAVQLAPDEPAPRLGLGIALDRLGDKAGALEAYRAFLARSKAESEKSDREAVAARVRVLEGKP